MARRIRLPGKLPKVVFPLHYEGAPPRRLYLPEWYITLAEPKERMPKNYVRFHVPADMTKYDVKEYLDTIYNVRVLNIKLSVVNYVKYRAPNIAKRSIPENPQYEWKFIEPWKIAHVFLPDGQTFEFPNILKNEKEDKNEKTLIEQMEEQQKYLEEAKKDIGTDDKSKIFLDNRWL